MGCWNSTRTWADSISMWRDLSQNCMLKAQLKVRCFSGLFMGFILFLGWKQREKTGLKTTRHEKSTDFAIFPDYFYKVSTFFGVRAWWLSCTRIWLIINPLCHQPNYLGPGLSRVSYKSKLLLLFFFRTTIIYSFSLCYWKIDSPTLAVDLRLSSWK